MNYRPHSCDEFEPVFLLTGSCNGILAYEGKAKPKRAPLGFRPHCPKCKGSGKRSGGTCRACGGHGKC